MSGSRRLAFFFQDSQTAPYKLPPNNTLDSTYSVHVCTCSISSTIIIISAVRRALKVNLMAMSVNTSIGAAKSLLDLPDEILLMICSLLQTRDALSVRTSCHRLRDIGSDPSLWNTIALSYYGPRDDPRLKSALKLSAPHLRKCAITDVSGTRCRSPTSQFLSLLKRSLNVTSVSLHGYQITHTQLNAIVSTLPRLQDLKVQLPLENEGNIMNTLRHASHLQSLVIAYSGDKSFFRGHCKPRCSERVVDLEILHEWSGGAGQYNPPELGLQFLSLHGPWNCDHLLTSISDLPSAKHEARFSLYDAPSAFVRLPQHPSVTVEFSPSKAPIIPCVQPKLPSYLAFSLALLSSPIT